MHYQEIKNPHSFPNVQLFMQSSSTPIDSDDPAFAEHRRLALLVLTHITCSHSAKLHIALILQHIAGEYAWAYNTKEIEIKLADIVTFLSDQTPRIIFEDLVPRGDRVLVWGEVRKGSEPRARENELYVSLELANVLRPDLSDNVCTSPACFPAFLTNDDLHSCHPTSTQRKSRHNAKCTACCSVLS